MKIHLDKSKLKKPRRRSDRQPASRRIRSPHPGVKIKKRTLESGTVNYTARWIDPYTKKDQYVSFEKLGITNKEKRVKWCKDKSKSLQEIRVAIASGAPTPTETTVNDAIKQYYDDKTGLKPKTVLAYVEATGLFETWAKKSRLSFIEELTQPRLMDFHAWHSKRKRRKPAKKGKRGERKKTVKSYSPYTRKKHLTSLKNVLNHWRKLGLLPNLSSDDIRDALVNPKTHNPAPDFLRLSEIKALLDSAIRHDNEMFTETREEHSGEREKGTTPQYEPITPFIILVLLTGMRWEEAAGLEWDEVHLNEEEAIIIGHERVKTATGRKISLKISPILLDLLSALKLKAGDQDYVFGDESLPRHTCENARKRLKKTYGAPKNFTWHQLRRTCGTYLCCSQSIYGDATIFLAAKRLGHSVAVCEKHYAGQYDGVAKEATTIEAAMGIEEELKEYIEKLSGQSVSRKSVRAS